MVAAAGCADETVPAEVGATGVLTEELRIDPYVHDLTPIQGVAVAGDGTIAIGQPQDGAVRFFSADGEPLGSVGKPGQGPGEFATVYTLGWVADTLWAFDSRQQRISLISPERAFVRHVPVPPRIVPLPDDATNPSYAFAVAHGLITDGTLIVVVEGFTAGRSPMTRDLASVARVAGDGTMLRQLHTISTVGLRVVTAQASMTMPFANIPWPAVSPDGRRSAVAIASLEGEDAGTFLLTVVEADGDTVLNRRYPYPSVPLPDAVFDSAMARYEGMGLSSGLVTALHQQVRRWPVYPPLTGLTIGSDGTAFVHMRADEGAEQPVLVIGADGNVTGYLSLPQRSRVAVGERDRIWVIERDEVDVEAVIRYAVEW